MTMHVYKHVLRPDTHLPDTTTCVRGVGADECLEELLLTHAFEQGGR